MISVSVIIPTYNRVHFLKDAVQSALEQTHPPLEIIVVDDGSTDNTPSVCQAFPPPVRYLRQENQGVSAARNHGVRAAQGEYIAFLDSDDVWEPDKLAAQLTVFKRYPEIAWCITDCTLVDVKGHPRNGAQGFAGFFPVFQDVGLSPDHFFSQSLSQDTVESGGRRFRVYTGDVFGLLFHGNFCTSQSIMLRRGIIDSVGLFDPALRVAEDTEYFHRVAAASHAAIVMSPLVRVRLGHESLVSAHNTVELIENALSSVARAAALRNPLGAREASAYQRGRHRLLGRLAYAKLPELDRRGARTVARQTAGLTASMALRSTAILLVSFLPNPVLRGLHAAKRLLHT